MIAKTSLKNYVEKDGVLTVVEEVKTDLTEREARQVLKQLMQQKAELESRIKQEKDLLEGINTKIISFETVLNKKTDGEGGKNGK
jgi:hypothetical protein